MAGVWTLREFSVPPAAVSGSFYYQGRLRAPSTFLHFPPGTETPGPLPTLPGDVRAWSRSLSMELYPWVYCHPTDEQSAGQWDHASAGVYEPQPLVLPEPRRPPPSSRQHPSPAVFPPHGRFLTLVVCGILGRRRQIIRTHLVICTKYLRQQMFKLGRFRKTCSQVLSACNAYLSKCSLLETCFPV